MTKEMKKILVTGAVGQIGSELTEELRRRYSHDQVVAAGHRTEPSRALRQSGPFERVDVTVKEEIERIIRKYKIDTIYHLGAILSAKGEQNPGLAWNVNMNGFYNILEVAQEQGLTRIFHPSSIGVFGPQTPQDNTPQETILSPTTIYGVTKVAGELLGDYYFEKFGVDLRGLRYPGIISSETPPGGGTTDYAVEIFYEAIKRKRYTCFVREDTVLPMMYMSDCLRAAIELMEAPLSKLKHHSNFNITAMSFSAGELTQEIRKHIPEFVCEFRPDFRQEIADSWPRTIDDSAAREEWGWRPRFGLAEMTEDMLEKLGRRHAEGRL